MTLNEIRQVVAEQFKRFEVEYGRHTHSTLRLLQDVNDYVDRRSGKRMRPLLLLLADAGRNVERAAKLSAAMEMLHSASLMHDDVVDESDTRRGQESVNGHWGNQIAVLCGDYYLSRVMQIMNDLGESAATDIVNNVVKEMTEGELLQLQLHMDDSRGSGGFDDYMQVIRKKTGALMQACCQLGDQRLKVFGDHFGTAFQLRDDLMDFDTEQDSLLPPRSVLQKELENRVKKAVEALQVMQPSKYRDALESLTQNLLNFNY